MSRLGRIHRPFYRINAIDKRAPRNGKVLEELGWYDPVAKDPSKQLQLNDERVKYWLSVGAQPSDTVNDILANRGLIDAEAWKAVRAQRIKRKVEAAAKAKAAEAAAAAAGGEEKKEG
ncbi:MAG: 30S ribosomal protein S16 [Planctomycetota bacterium]|nr:30S ribosomal protein S16 [Planctomycetota bacterium]